MGYLKNILIAIDQLANALCCGWPDETLSSRAFRWNRCGLRHWPCLIIDRLFFWDTEKRDGLIVRHCQLSYESEQLRLQHPPELR